MNKKTVSKVVPLYHRLIIEQDPPETMYGNLYLPDVGQARVKPLIGTVVGVGHGILQKDGSLQPLIVKPGDRVLYHEYSGLEFHINGKAYLQMQEDNLIGIIEEVEDGKDEQEMPGVQFENVH